MKYASHTEPYNKYAQKLRPDPNRIQYSSVQCVYVYAGG